jgi:hypothetical protein
MTPALRRQYLAARGRVFGGLAIDAVERLKDRQKLRQFGASAELVDPHASELRDIPREDRFLAAVASAAKAKYVVVNDHKIPRRTVTVRLRGGARLEIEFVDHRELVARLTAAVE